MKFKPLTGIRGIAALWVVAYHFLTPYTKLISEQKGGSFIFLNNFFQKGYLSVDLFFFLSAIVLTMVYQDKFNNTITSDHYKTYLMKRLIRIYPLYFVVVGISFLLQKEVDMADIFTQLSLTQIYFNTYLKGIIYPAWSLCTEFAIYLIFPFLLKFLLRMENLGKIGLLILALATIYSIQFLQSYYFDLDSRTIKVASVHGGLNISFGSLTLVRTLCSYLIGILLCNYLFKFPKTMLYICLLILPVLIMNNLNDWFIYLCLIFIPSACVNIKFLSCFFSWRPIHYLGEISYSVYLTHALVFFILENNFNNLPYLRVLAFIITPIISIVTYEIIEKPAKSFLLKQMDALAMMKKV
ncbi:hypothetical protein BWD42_07230 [Sphingobacterium sp. CZ-UAM]|uniref:acyltransferase family protein n=1 Tax=Sphingobacterium sp. CZ-UAM TaxID=1933868 RepID=UPI000985D970|nr:acyltransferase [Sphingobacterium sp. CZ-UAM]OOG19690.1 hypothetical protein BWD42_07230 [Sphingobacterium sp. CZ-UAM]